jgi:hypothetical protein
VNIQLVHQVYYIYELFYNYFLLLFIVNIHKRSWLHMLNPLSRHKSNRSSDFEGPTSTDTTSYIGKKEKFLEK